MEVQLEAQVNFPTMSQSVVFNKENPTLVLCGGSRSAPRGTPTWALLPRSWTVFGGSSWGLSWRHFCVKETDESTEKIHGKSMTPRKKIMNPLGQNPCTPENKFMARTGGENPRPGLPYLGAQEARRPGAYCRPASALHFRRPLRVEMSRRNTRG